MYFRNHAQSRLITLFLPHFHTSVVTAPCQKDPKGSSSPPISCPDQDSTETGLWWFAATQKSQKVWFSSCGPQLEGQDSFSGIDGAS